MATFRYPQTQTSITGGATEAKQDTMITELQDINTELDGQTTSLSSIATNTSDNATETTLATVKTDTATIAGDTTSIDAKTPALGAAVTASSTPVNIASDQTVPVSASSLPLPTGAATEATLSSIDTDTTTIAGDTTSIDNKTPALGAAVTASSTPVNIASDQTVPVSAASLPLPTGAATETTLSTVAGDTTSIDSKTPALGAATTANSTPVNIASDQVVSVTTNALTPVDFLDSGLLDSASTNIPTAGVQVVASLAANVTELEIIDDIGEFMSITDGADTVLAYLPLGGGRVKLSISSGTAIKLASLTGSAITTGQIAINFLG